jgi:hypothetical protein
MWLSFAVSAFTRGGRRVLRRLRAPLSRCLSSSGLYPLAPIDAPYLILKKAGAGPTFVPDIERQ